MFNIKKDDLIRVYASNLGIESSSEIINRTIREHNFNDADEYSVEEIIAICSEIQKLSPLIKTITQAYLIQIERGFRKKAELERWESENRFAILLEAIPDIVYFKDSDRRYIYINKTFERLSGLSRSAVTGREIEHQAEVFTDPFKENDEHVMITKKSISYEENFIRHDGTEIILDTVKVPLFDEKNFFSGLVAISRDITERKHLELEIQKSRNLESIGILAGGIAHDFNNILTAIVGNISFARILSVSGSELEGTLMDAERACIKAKGLTQQLLTFANGGAPLKKTASVLDIVRDTADFVTRGTGVAIEYSIHDDLWFVDADSGQISQVINNLIINAVQAMPGGGRIKISFQNVTVSPDQNLALDKGRYVRISITDEGYGISEKNISKIFDPYFTTKPGGSGLGLATSYSIIKRHNGQIMVESASGAGAGTTFTIHLPASSKSAEKNIDSSKQSGRSSSRVLLMDDDKMILDITGKLLRHMGYTVETAENGEQAIAVYKDAMDKGGPFDIVILDLTIPGGMGGSETLIELLKIDRGVNTIASSGYTNDPIMTDFSRYGFSGTASKPYIIEELCNTIEETISRRL